MDGTATTPVPPQLLALDYFFPGFSVLSTAAKNYLGIDLNVYIPLIILCGAFTFAWQYFSDYVWGLVESHLMSSVEVRTDDEIYNILMAWVATQKFAKRSRRFIANTNLNSRAWAVWRWYDDEDDEENDGDEDANSAYGQKKKRSLAYTPSFGNHMFWYRGWLLRFKRSQDKQQGFMSVSEREEISISCFGRSPWVLKQLLNDARQEYLSKDTKKTMIYRGGIRSGSTDPTWQRCMARNSRPFSTVILDEKKKKELIEDVSDYLSPATRNWYANRGIPWRRGYLLTGPPGTGKSSLSLALAGYFNMRIYIVSLSSITASEENLATLFADLPQRCVVLLEDIDTAGLTHTREENAPKAAGTGNTGDGNNMVPGQITTGNDTNDSNKNNTTSRLSLSGLLNILDGVASQEGRVLVMTTNHVEKLDKALIRPGRVDMTVEFTLADEAIIGAIFRAIYAPLEGDEGNQPGASADEEALSPEDEKAEAERAAAKRAEVVAHVEKLSREFAIKIPAHEFSPAEIQGFLMRHKRNAEKALEMAEEWVVDTRKQKKEQEIKAAEEKRVAEQKRKEEEKKKQEEKEKEEAEAEKKKKEEEQKAAAEKAKTSESTPATAGAKSDDPAVVVAEGDAARGKPENIDVQKTKTGTDSGYVTPVASP